MCTFFHDKFLYFTCNLYAEETRLKSFSKTWLWIEFAKVESANWYFHYFVSKPSLLPLSLISIDKINRYKFKKDDSQIRIIKKMSS